MPLTAQGRDEARGLAELLGRVGLRPEVYLTSQYRHARETAELIAEHLNDGMGPRVLGLDALTPMSATDTLEDVCDEANTAEVDLSGLQVVAVVGHEPRLSQLLTRLTSKRARPLERAEAVCLEAESFRALLQGGARLAFRLPVVDHQEEGLREKIRSKMTVATLLAGFAFAALVEILIGPASPAMTGLQRMAVTCPTAAVGLFVAAVYIYDRLAMPEGFWVYGERPTGRQVWSKGFREARRQHGPLYAYMVWTWNWVFTPGVAFGIVAFLMILLQSGDAIAIGSGFVVIVAILAYYARVRPRLGSD